MQPVVDADRSRRGAQGGDDAPEERRHRRLLGNPPDELGVLPEQRETVHLVDDGGVVDPVVRGVDVEPLRVADALCRARRSDQYFRGVAARSRHVQPSGPGSTSAVSSPAAAPATVLPVPLPITITSKSVVSPERTL